MRAFSGWIGVLALCACVTEDSPGFVEYETREAIIGFHWDSSIVVRQDMSKVSHFESGREAVEVIYSMLRKFNYRTDEYTDLLDFRGYGNAFIRGNGLYLLPGPLQERFPTYRRFDLATHALTGTDLTAGMDFYLGEDELMLYQCSFGIEQITALADGRPILKEATGAGGHCACPNCKLNIGPRLYLYNPYADGRIQYRIIDFEGNTSLHTTQSVLSGSYRVNSMGQVPYALDSAGTLHVPAEFDSSGKIAEAFRKIKAHGPQGIVEVEVEQGLFIEGDSLRSLATMEVVHIPHGFPPAPSAR